jgi:RimJ/RimL family protein N-acetyltransferase
LAGKILINSERLFIRAPRPEDFDPLHQAVLSDAEVMRFAFHGQPFDRDRALGFFSNVLDHEATGRKPGILIERSTNDVIGFAGPLLCSVLGEPDYEIGFVLSRRTWGRGYASEIGRAQIEHGFTTLKLDRVLAQVSPENAASIRVLERLGMRRCTTTESSGRGIRLVYVIELSK